MQRLLTAAVATPLILAALFLLPPAGFFLLIALFIEVAVWEYLAIVRRRAPHAPLNPLLVLVPLAALAMSALLPDRGLLNDAETLLAFGALLAVGLGSLVLLSRTPLEEAIPALGVLAFGIPYFA